MSFAKRIGLATLYQGSSFTISLGREDDAIWDDNYTAVLIVTNEENAEMLNKVLVKSADKLSLTFQIDKSDCDEWIGGYRAIAYLRDSNDEEINIPIGDYDLFYETTVARSK